MVGLSAAAPPHIASLLRELVKFLESRGILWNSWQFFSRSSGCRPLTWEAPGATRWFLLRLVREPQLTSYCASRCTGDQTGIDIYINLYFFLQVHGYYFWVFKWWKQCQEKDFLPEKYCDGWSCLDRNWYPKARQLRLFRNWFIYKGLYLLGMSLPLKEGLYLI